MKKYIILLALKKLIENASTKILLEKDINFITKMVTLMMDIQGGYRPLIRARDEAKANLSKAIDKVSSVHKKALGLKKLNTALQRQVEELQAEVKRLNALIPKVDVEVNESLFAIADPKDLNGIETIQIINADGKETSNG